VKQATVFTHRRPDDTATAIQRAIAAAAQAGWILRFDPGETAKLGLREHRAIALDAPVLDDADLCLVFGGDGTILRALARYTRLPVPVFGINFGEVGFLATGEPDALGEVLDCAFSGKYELLTLPAVELDSPHGPALAFNDVSIHRKVGERVAELAFGVQGETLGRVRADGIVVATPAGSTGYNLANGGPVLAWGVEGYVVSFIAPHSLTARPLVVAPSDEMLIENRSREPLDVSVDGRPQGELEPGMTAGVRFAPAVGTIAQLTGTSFYRRLQQKFGQLTS
jgi:NAD+ kinase